MNIRSNPETYVVGSSPKVDALGTRVFDVDPPLQTLGGKIVGTGLIRATPAWNKGHVVEVARHWRNEGARRRCGGDMSKATGDEIVMVPVYRGVAQRVVTHHRAAVRRGTGKTA